MKKILYLLLIGLIAFSSMGFSRVQTIKMGTLAPEGSVWHNALREMGEEWQRVSDGNVRMRLYSGGVAGDEMDMVRKMRISQLHGAALTGNGLAGIAQENAIFQMPMFLRTDEELDHVLHELSPKIEKIMEEKGFKLLYWSEIGRVYLFSNKPVVTPEDLKPLKIWVWTGDAVWADALKDRGYKPVPLPSTEIHTGLSSGLIDTVSAPPVAALSYQWFGLAKNMMSMKWGPLTAAVVISKKEWEKIPANLRPQIHAAAVKAGAGAKERIRKLESEAIKAMQGYGLKVNKVSPQVAATWQSEIEKTYPNLLGKSIPKEIYQEASKILKEFRKKNK
ncbi:MAG: TRAP transporter substrate-binding protein DctP [Spirochaetia bacterium]|nr:TRAP transporter substrate-binding protein DctP [Spirochaetia bacterium]